MTTKRKRVPSLCLLRTIMNHSPSPDIIHYNPSSLSETETFSDSDWLDIASNRESDTESVSSNNGLSRRSSISTGSSRNEEVEAWEGFIEEIADELPVPETNAPHSNEHSNSPFIDLDEIHVEERRVRDGLDQSLTSTLSTSRTSSRHSTVHNSLRDLRLSFPDPLNSSHDELNSSYDRVSSSEGVDVTDGIEENELGSSQVALMEPALIQDPGLPSTPEVPGQDTLENIRIISDVRALTLQVVLYGTTPKWSFVDELLRKFIVGGELAGFERAIETEQLKPVVFDRTDNNRTPRSDYNPNRPSLAIVFHPFTHATIPKHTVYLPVVAPENDDSFEKEFQEAQIIWASYHVPTLQVLRLEGSSSSLMFASEDVDKLDPYHTHQAIQRILRHEKPASWLGLFEQFNTVHAVTLFALLCIIVGFSVNTAISVQPLRGNAILPPSPTISGKGDSNQSSALAVRTTSSISVVPASFNYASALYERGTMSSPGAGPSSSTLPPSQSEDSNVDPTTQGTLATWAERMKFSKDVIIRPSTSVSARTSADISSSSDPVASTSKTQSSCSAVGTRLVDSLSEIVAASMKALVEVVEHDWKDLMVAIDELVLALHRSTVAVVEQSKSAAQVIREQLEYRNARAKNRARELKAKGMQIMSYAGDHILGRATTAKQKAHSLKDVAVFRRSEWKDKLKHGAQRARHRARHHKNGMKSCQMEF
ncbi:hypothetical protein DFH05DRAFT_1495098 [Lentinula detonsa]|uniref:Uncharacterized protein n=1 Tax=Lentinula detonsa TaxID=2804962 RepID=A0A9W8TXG9_9AGAR|nr:hypothetical protein DFH05DRAFT_1495098 [Lentinula detonsa]